MRNTTDLGVIAAGASASVNLETIKSEFGLNFNTILITNNAAEEISLTLDRKKIAFISGNGAVFGLDWEDNIQFTDVTITNEDGAAATSANEIRITVGRTGAKV